MAKVEGYWYVPDRPLSLLFLDYCVMCPQATFSAHWLLLFVTSATSFTDEAIALPPSKPDSIWQFGRQVSLASLCPFFSVFLNKTLDCIKFLSASSHSLTSARNILGHRPGNRPNTLFSSQTLVLGSTTWSITLVFIDCGLYSHIITSLFVFFVALVGNCCSCFYLKPPCVPYS